MRLTSYAPSTSAMLVYGNSEGVTTVTDINIALTTFR